jgi:hypothetical protein
LHNASWRSIDNSGIACLAQQDNALGVFPVSGIARREEAIKMKEECERLLSARTGLWGVESI